MNRRDRATAWANEQLADDRVVFLDTESTGLDASARICDIAIIGFDGSVLVEALVNPLVPIPAEATAIHGISDAMVAGALTFAELYHDIYHAISGNRVVVYNQEFDQRIINQCADAGRLPIFPWNGLWQCAMKAYADWDGTPGKYGGPRWWKLPEACERLTIPFVETHRARADAEACRLIVRTMAGT